MKYRLSRVSEEVSVLQLASCLMDLDLQDHVEAMSAFVFFPRFLCLNSSDREEWAVTKRTLRHLTIVNSGPNT